MIKLESTKLTIEIPGSAVDNWTEIISDLLDLLYCQDQNYISHHQGILLLLQHMMPDHKQVKAMQDIAPEKKE